MGYTLDIHNHPYGFKYYNCPQHKIEGMYSIVMICEAPSGHYITLCASQSITESQFMYDPNLKVDNKDWGSDSWVINLRE